MRLRGNFLVVSCMGASMIVWLIFLTTREEWGVPVYAGDDVMIAYDPAFLVKSSECTIPSHDPWSPEYKSYHTGDIKLIDCNPDDKPTLTRVEGGDGVVIEKSAFSSHGFNETTSLCYYALVERVSQTRENYTKDADNKYSFGEAEKFDILSGIQDIPAEGIKVWCEENGNKLYENIHFLLPKKNVEEKIRTAAKVDQSKKNLNFIMVGIESTSRLNFDRYMPKTKQFLEKNTLFLNFKGYNKIGQNSAPNISPLLNGIEPEFFLDDFKHECYPSRYHHMDDCPFIWKNFSEKGYVTVFIEDWPGLGLFHYYRTGWIEQPTDYYSRSTQIAARDIIGHEWSPSISCYGDKMISEVNLEHLYNVFENFHGKVPIFAYNFLTSLTHNSDTNHASLDDIYLHFFTRFLEKGYMNDTIILFYGDHGFRFSDFRETHLGRVEENMALMTLILPEWFKTEYPDTLRNLEANQHKLTSNYDVYLTMTDILESSFITSRNLAGFSGYGQSLFGEVASNRSCADAGIPPHYCSCEIGEQIDPERDDVQNASVAFLNATNNILADVLDVCEPLSIIKVLSSQYTTTSQDDGWSTYRLVVETLPGHGKFDATVLKNGDSWRASEDISRVNLYGDQSHCVESNIHKLLCYCKQQLS